MMIRDRLRYVVHEHMGFARYYIPHDFPQQIHRFIAANSKVCMYRFRNENEKVAFFNG